MNILANINETRTLNEIKRLEVGDTVEFRHTDESFVFDYSIRNLIKSTVSQYTRKSGAKFKTTCKRPYKAFIVERVETATKDV